MVCVEEEEGNREELKVKNLAGFSLGSKGLNTFSFHRGRYEDLIVNIVGESQRCRALSSRDLEIVRPEQVWVSDITYVCLRDDFVCLAVIMDVFTRGIVDGIWDAAWITP